MLIVGEKINTSRKKIAEAVERRDKEFIVEIARRQAEAGAHFIDVNAGTFVERETDCLCWLVETVQEKVDLPLCLDSPNPKALKAALALHRGEAMINSISLEKERYEALLPVVTGVPCRIIALCMGETAMPVGADQRFDAANEIINRLGGAGIPHEKIFVDPLIQPVSIDTSVAGEALKAMTSIMATFPKVQTICGLSNVSFGLPSRGLLNRNFLTLALSSGLSAAILDPTDVQLMATLRAAEVLLDKDQYCEKYIDAYQAGILG